MKCLALLTLLVASVVPGSCALVRSPMAFGNVVSFSPFYVYTSDAPSVRYQQVYGASDFTGMGTSHLLIQDLIFFVGGPSPNLNITLADIRIDLSTTVRGPDGLSMIFADNVGANNTVVYSGTLSFSHSALGLYHITLQTPFIYEPGAGNLLMDVRNFQPVPPPPNERAYNRAEFTLGDSVSRVSAFDVNSLTGFADTAGLVTAFDVTPIPEPSSGALLVVGMLACALARRNKTRIGTRTMTSG